MMGGDLKQQSSREVDGSRRTPARAARQSDTRRRLVEGFTKAVAEQGYARTDVEDVIARAGLSRSDFDSHFEGLDQCLLAAHDAFFERLWKVTVEACAAQGEDWRCRLRAGLSAALDFLVDVPGLARVFVVEVVATGPAGIERRQAALARFAELLRGGRSRLGGDPLPDLTEQFLVAGVASVVEERLLMEEAELLPSLRDELADLLLAPYMGRDEPSHTARAQRV